MVAKPKLFASEVDLCAAFIKALPRGWTSYPETQGWDILLVRDDGFQIGIQAKLKFNAHVLDQALEDGGFYNSAGRPGPDCRAILVPANEGGLGNIAAYIGITVLKVHGPYPRYSSGPAFTPSLPVDHQDWTTRDWYELLPLKRHKLPAYVPDVAAGASAPVQLTDWKIRAIKLVITATRRGYLTRADFKTLGLDVRFWVAREGGWLRRDGDFFRLEGAAPLGLKNQHPRVYAEIEAEADLWMFKVPPLPPSPQKGLL